MADEKNELAETLKALADEAAAGELSDESRVRMGLLRNNIRIVDVAASIEKRRLATNEIKRSDFEALGQADRMAKMRSGVRVVDDAEIE